MRNFHLDTLVKLGDQGMQSLTDFADDQVLVVTDDFLSSTPMFQKMRGLLGERVHIFSDVLPNPTTAAITKGVGVYLETKPDVVVAYGGGSVLDTAKAVHKAALDAGFGAREGIVAIPTTSGSGSEVTSFAVITDESTQTKIPVVSRDMVARIAILDPDVVMDAPAMITADSGLDALTHAIEAYVSNGACDFSDALAEKAAALVFAYLRRCHDDGTDREAREHMHNASCLAAMAFDNVGLGITHSLAHAIGGHFPIAHGRLNAMLMQHVIAFNADRSAMARERYARLGRLVAPSAIGPAAVTSLIGAIAKLNTALGIPATIAGAGFDVQDYRETVAEMAATAMEDGCTPTNPVAPTHEDLVMLLRKLG